MTTQDRGKDKWLKTLSTSANDFHAVVAVAKSEDKVKDLKAARKKAAVLLSKELLSPYSNESFLNAIKISDQDHSFIERTREKMVADFLLSQQQELLRYEDAYNGETERHVSYLLEKQSFFETRRSLKDQKIQLAVIELNKADSLLSSAPFVALQKYARALLNLEMFWGEEMKHESGKNIDVLLHKKLNATLNNFSIQTDPEKTIELNAENKFSNFLSFELMYNNEKTDPMDVSIDLAGVRHEKVNTNAYSVLVHNLPPILNKPQLAISSEPCAFIRSEGGDLAQILYRSLKPMRKTVDIVRVTPTLIYSEAVNETRWEKISFDVVKNQLDLMGYKEEKGNANSIFIDPNIEYEVIQNDEIVKLSGQWVVTLGEDMETISLKKIIVTNTNFDKAQSELTRRLVEQSEKRLMSDLIEKLGQ